MNPAPAWLLILAIIGIGMGLAGGVVYPITTWIVDWRRSRDA